MNGLVSIMDKRIFITLLCVIYVVNSLFAQAVHDSVFVYFRQGDSRIDTFFLKNGVEVNRMVDRYTRYRRDFQYRLKKIQVISSASPEGPYVFNVALSAKRADVIVSFLRNETASPMERVEVKSLGVDWDGLQELVFADTNMPYRNDVLDILSSPLEHQQRLFQLQTLQEGVPYRYMYRHLFPVLRRSRIVFEVEEAPQVDASRIIPMAEVSPFPSLLDVSRQPLMRHVGTVSDTETVQRWALKTNLLYDALLSPSLEVEYRFAPHWSALAEFSIAWWRNKGCHKYYQLAQFSPEVRYWLDGMRPWKGHYFGAFLGVGHYDLQNGKEGYKGEYGMAGLSYGYMFPVGRDWSLDAGIGLGYLYTEYEEYLPVDGHNVYQQTSRTNYIGPVKAKLSLVWRINQEKIDRLFRWMKGGVR